MEVWEAGVEESAFWQERVQGAGLNRSGTVPGSGDSRTTPYVRGSVCGKLATAGYVVRV